MHQHIPSLAGKYRELFGTMLISFFRYLLLCVHGAVGCCDVMACRGKLKFQLLSRFYFFAYIFFINSFFFAHVIMQAINLLIFLFPPFAIFHFSSCHFQQLLTTMAAVNKWNKDLNFHLPIMRRHRDLSNVCSKPTVAKSMYSVLFIIRCVYMHKRMSMKIRKGTWLRQLKNKRKNREYFYFLSEILAKISFKIFLVVIIKF